MVVGYTPYVNSINDILLEQERVVSGMTRETERCQKALALAASGKSVALVSSGDAGIYGMAGLAMEIAAKERLQVEIEVIPGVTAASAAASLMGAPLMSDFAVISLSDLLVPWMVIETRLRAVAQADLVTCLYNPRSRTRKEPLKNALGIFRSFRPGNTIVGVAGNAGKESAAISLATLETVDEAEIDMHTTVIVGNSNGRILQGHWVTLRGYQI